MQIMRAALFLALTSCLQIGPDGADGGAAATTGSAGSSSTTAGATKGAACKQHQPSGISLCKQMDLCPALIVDAELYDNCGFRVPSSGIDLECFCGDALCPAGTALTCTDAQNLLAVQSELLICSQLSEGRCAALPPSN